MQPIELRLRKATTSDGTRYAFLKVWPGVGNTSYGMQQFKAYRDALAWARQTWPKIPVIRDY